MSNILRSNSTTVETDPSTEDSSGIDPEPAYEATTEDAIQRARLYSLVSIGLDRPDDEFERLLDDGVFAADIKEAAAALDNEELADAAAQVADLAESHEFDELYYEWSSLFGVEEGVTVSPYELTYLPGPLLTSTRDLADISGFYKAFGLEIADGQNDRADHVVFQTEFLSHLALREATLRDEADLAGVEVVTEARLSFVEEHIGRWFWRFADEVSKEDDLGFHTAVINLLSALVESEIDRMGVDPEWVPDHPEVIEWTEDVFGDSGRGCGGCGVDGDGLEDELEGMGMGPPEQNSPTDGMDLSDSSEE